MKARLIHSFFASAFLLFAAAFCFSQTIWYVDDDNTAGPWDGSQAHPFQYIQDGIDAALDGDTILVLPGHYIEDITIQGKDITLRSDSDGDSSTYDICPADTVIDANQVDRVVAFFNVEAQNSAIDGFTIANGSTEYNGGGIYCSKSSPTIIHNIISGNSAGIHGGGIGSDYYSSPTITHNTINGNSAINGGGISCLSTSPIITHNTISGNSASHEGGGIYCYSSSPTITNNTINGNDSADTGGGIRCDYYCSAIITNNTINGNDSADTGGGISCYYYCSLAITNNTINGNSAVEGGGIYCRLSSPTISNNTISNNSVTTGGGIYCYQNSSPTISKNSVNGNSAHKAGGIYCYFSSPTITNNTVKENWAVHGGGIYCYFSSSPTITNNTISRNSAFYGGGFYCESDSFPVIVNTILWDNTASTDPGIFAQAPSTLGITYCDIQGGWPGEGNIDGDPLFADPASDDFHLRFDSPCLDMGNNEALGLPETDFEGDVRIVEGNYDGSAVVDMGADELLPEIAARFGTVNSLSPSLANVLLVNGSSGNNQRICTASTGNRITMTLLNSPAASIPGDFGLYWIWWEPGFGDLALQPEGIGVSCMPMPLSNFLSGNPPYPPPLTLANKFGHNWLLGYPLIQALPPAPCTVFDVPQLPPGTYTFQGYILDNGSACPYGVSLTNAIVLKVQ